LPIALTAEDKRKRGIRRGGFRQGNISAILFAGELQQEIERKFASTHLLVKP
jgi:hypothetical protein